MISFLLVSKGEKKTFHECLHVKYVFPQNDFHFELELFWHDTSSIYGNTQNNQYAFITVGEC